MTNPLPYLEQRKLVKRWSGPIAPIANLIFTLILFAITWWIFQDPRGVMRFYTPYVGYNYCRWWLIILIWMAYIFDFWPFKRKDRKSTRLNSSHKHRSRMPSSA